MLRYKILSFVVFAIIWELVAKTSDSIYIVTFTQTLTALGDLFINQNLLIDILASFKRIFWSVFTVFLISIPLGMLISQSNLTKIFSTPVTKFLRYIPAPTLIPLAVIWLGIGEISKIFLVSWGIFFPTLLAIRDASDNVPKDFLNLGYSMGYSKSQNIKHIILPYIAPDIINLLRVI